MPLTTINGRDGTADFTINSQSYATVFNFHSVESTVDQIDTSVFSIEGVPTWDPGMEFLRCRVAGILKKGAAQAGPIIPAPQGATILQQFSTGCTISGTVNFDRMSVGRMVNRVGTVAGEGRYTGAFVVTWVHS